MDAAELRSHLYHALGEAFYENEVTIKGVPVVEDRPWNPDKRKIANVIEAMQAVGHLSTEVEAPAWIDLHSAAETPASQMVSCTNGVLDLSNRTLIGHTPALFNTVSVPFDYDADAAEPSAWKKFLSSVWPDDPDSISLLQEFFGYTVSGRTDMQKILLVIGPTRAGKGTIGRILTALVGRGHVAGPTLASLGTNFGLSPLLGKPLAIISDARLGSDPPHAVVERLLSISGEDMITVDVKFKDPWSGRLPTRFAILSNELPKFRDSSGAIANRLLILQMTNSFLGREDRTLDQRLVGELPGILNWALAGLDRLFLNGKFTVPGSSDDAAKLMMDLASPMSAFVRDCCQRGAGATVTADQLYSAWKMWAEDNGHHAGAKSTFGRDLRAVVPEIKVSQPTVGTVRIRSYVGIGLLPVHPMQGDKPASQDGTTDDGSGSSSRARPVQEELPTAPCTGCGNVPHEGNALVNGYCTGCTGRPPFKAERQDRQPPPIGAPTDRTPGMTDRVQHALAKARPPLCPDCQRAPARTDTRLCDFCTARGRRQAAADPTPGPPGLKLKGIPK
jgi:putative DNA primase/helicase